MDEIINDFVNKEALSPATDLLVKDMLKEFMEKYVAPSPPTDEEFHKLIKRYFAKYFKSYYLISRYAEYKSLLRILRKVRKTCQPKELPKKTEPATIWITLRFLWDLHPELKIEEVINLKAFASANTVTRKECYGEGQILYPLWKKHIKARKNEKDR